MFTTEDRDRVRDRVLDLASADSRVVAGAVLGSLAHDEGDRWSDLDLMFAVVDEVPLTEVLEAWSEDIIRAFEAVHLFDLPRGPIIYRVFLLPGWLELDLSFTPASEFGAGGPKFRLLFGEAVELPEESPTPAHELFGYAVHHALHAGWLSSADSTGRRSIGSARYATTDFTSRVAAGVSMAGTGETSTDCPPRSWIRSTMHSCDRSTETNSIGRWGTQSPRS